MIWWLICGFIIIISFVGCAINLKVDKPIQLENIYNIPDKNEILDENLANSFSDNRRYIFRALINTPCFLGNDSRAWANLLNQYGKGDIDGFIEWATNGVLYNQSGGQFLNNYFKQVKLVYEGMKK